LGAAGIIVVLLIAAWAVPLPIIDGMLLATATYEGGPYPGGCAPCRQPQALIRVRLGAPGGPLITQTRADAAGRVRVRLKPGVYNVSWAGCRTTAVVLPWRTTSAAPTCQIK